MFTRVLAAMVIGLVLCAGPMAVAPALGATEGHAAPGTEEWHTAPGTEEGHAAPGTEEGHAALDTEGGHGDVDINPLDFQRDLAIWTAVIFLVLMGVLWKFAWGPIARGLEKREQGIADEIASAERSNVEARQLLEEYQQRLAATGQEVQAMLQAARRNAEQAGHEIVDKAKAEAQIEHQRAMGEIELATTNALKELAEQSATLAVGLAGRIVRSELDPKAHSQLIAQAMSDFSQKSDGNGGPRGG